MDILPILAILIVGIGVGFINIVSAGGSMLTLPMLIFFGLPSNVANGMNRIAILFQNIFAMYQFHKNGHLNWKLGLALSVPTTIASIYGAQIAVDIAENTFDNLLATFMIIFAVLLIIKPQRFIKEKFNQTTSIILLFIAFIFIGIYGGALQAGVGFFIMLTLLPPFLPPPVCPDDGWSQGISHRHSTQCTSGNSLRMSYPDRKGGTASGSSCCCSLPCLHN